MPAFAGAWMNVLSARGPGDETLTKTPVAFVPAWIVSERCCPRRGAMRLSMRPRYCIGKVIRLFFIYNEPVLNREAVPPAWVVKCTGCGCTVNAVAVDPQLNPALEKAEPAPSTAMMVTCACCWGCYRYSPHDAFKGMPQPNEKCRYWKARLAVENEDAKPGEKEPSGAVIVAGSMIAAMLLRDELRADGIRSSPRVVSKIHTAVQLADMVAQHVKRK